jgi:hypothetical protein
LAPAAFADTISGSAGDGFRTWGATDLTSQSGFPYWNNVSSDLCSPSPCSGTHKDNIGFILTNTGNAGGTLSSPPGAIPFWGGAFTSGVAAGGAADPNFFFVKNSTGGGAVLKAEVTARTTNNAFGWFDTSSPNTLHPIFAGGTAVGTSASFTPSADYGFYFTTCEAGSPTCTDLVVWETEASHNHHFTGNTLLDTSDQHFTAFEQSATPGSEVYWLGMEDLRFGAPSDRDYNDMVVRIEYQGAPIPPSSVPEPSSMMLLGSGLLMVSIGLGLRHRVFTR